MLEQLSKLFIGVFAGGWIRGSFAAKAPLLRVPTPPYPGGSPRFPLERRPAANAPGFRWSGALAANAFGFRWSGALAAKVFAGKSIGGGPFAARRRSYGYRLPSSARMPPPARVLDGGHSRRGAAPTSTGSPALRESPRFPLERRPRRECLRVPLERRLAANAFDSRRSGASPRRFSPVRVLEGGHSRRGAAPTGTGQKGFEAK